MATIKSWSGSSPHAREVAALDELRKGLPSNWFGYANVFVKDPRSDTGYEVDLILISDDRILRMPNSMERWSQSDIAIGLHMEILYARTDGLIVPFLPIGSAWRIRSPGRLRYWRPEIMKLSCIIPARWVMRGRNLN